MIKNQQPLTLQEILEVLTTAKKEDIDVSVCCSIVRCNCDCKCTCNCGGGTNPGVDPDTSAKLYVTPDVTAVNAAARIAECNELLFRWNTDTSKLYSAKYSPEKGTGEPVYDRYWGTRSSKTGTVEYYFKRPQYITGYEISIAEVKGYSPKEWKLYLSKDSGQTWELAHSEDFNMSTITKKSWNLKPDFYNAYKMEVLNTCNNSRLAVWSLRMLGQPTEVIPANMEKASRYGVTVSANQVTNPLNATWVFVANHFAQIAKNGYIDYVFDEAREATSCGIITQDDTIKGWEILGSNDSGTTWDVISSQTNQTLVSGKEHTYDFYSPALYKQYRFVAKDLGSVANGKLTYFQLYR